MTIHQVFSHTIRLFVLFLTTTTITTTSVRAHFSSGTRVIGVYSQRRTQGPRCRSNVFGSPFHLVASTATSFDGVASQIGEEEEVILDDLDFDSISQPVSTSASSSRSGIGNNSGIAKEIKSFKELGFAGKLVRGTRNIILVTSTNFALGVAFGLTSAGIRGFPNLMTRKEGLLGTPWKEEIPMRLKRYSGKCSRWAKIWGPVFAVWGFTDTFVSILRNGDNDEFNFMIASSAAAVWHNREKSIQRKIGVAILYAALTYGYVKFNEYYVVGPEGWQDKYNQNDDNESSGETLRGGHVIGDYEDTS